MNTDSAKENPLRKCHQFHIGWGIVKTIPSSALSITLIENFNVAKKHHTRLKVPVKTSNSVMKVGVYFIIGEIQF